VRHALRVTELHVDAAGASLSGEVAGEGTPVVLLHGLTATRRYVVMGSRALERDDHRVIAYDARGHGRSGPAPSAGAYDYGALATDLGAVLDAAGAERAVLAGASMGAHTLLRFALEHPERAAGLVVITPAFDPDDRDGRHLERWDRLSRGLREGGVDGFIAAYGEPRVPEKWRETIRTVLRQRLSQHEHPDAVADALHAVPRSRPFESWDDLRALELPVVVVASRDEPDPEHPYAIGERYAATIPGAELRSEEPGASPLAWQGSQLSRVIAEVAGRGR
jgi:pimeloyl-ACP methyl ester carboxylesterase